MEDLTIDEILANIKEHKGALPPKLNAEYYIFLSGNYCWENQELAKLSAQRVGEIGKLLAQNPSCPVSKVERIVDSLEVGQKLIMQKAKLEGVLELIRALKRAQGYFENEARNLY